MAELSIEQQRALAMARARQRADQAAQQKTYSGSILPFSRNAAGDVSFDSDAGLVGVVKRAFTAPKQAMSGELPMWGDDGHTSDQAIARSGEAAAVVSPLPAAIRSEGMAIPGAATAMRKPKVTPPTSEQLKTAAAKGYDDVRNMGVDYDIGAVTNLASRARAELERDGINAELAPKTFSILKKLENPPEGSIATLDGLEIARRTLKNARRDFNNPTDQLAASRLAGRLDEFVEAPDAASVVAGPAAAAGKRSAEARANYAAGKRSDQLRGIEDTADLNAAVANSGQNIDNAIRQRAAAVLKDPRKRAGYSKGELDLIRGVAEGRFARNTLRYVGNLLGGGGGLGAVVTGGMGGAAGGALGGPAGMAIGAGIPVMGVGAKKAANSLTRRSLNKADEAVRKRSPLYEEMLRNTPSMPVLAPEREALIKSIIMSQQAQDRR